MPINDGEDPVNRSCMQLLLVIIMAYLGYNYALNSAKDVMGIKYGLNIAESLAVDKYLTHFFCVFPTIVCIFLILLLAFGKSILIERVYCCAVLYSIMRCLVGFYNGHGPLWVPQTLSKRKKRIILELVIIIVQFDYFANLLINFTLLQIYICIFLFSPEK